MGIIDYLSVSLECSPQQRGAKQSKAFQLEMTGQVSATTMLFKVEARGRTQEEQTVSCKEMSSSLGFGFCFQLEHLSSILPLY